MTGRSLCCSSEGIEKARKALIRFSLTQKALAQELEVTRQPIGKFFTGKPVDRNLFVQICDRLDLEWEEVVAEPPTESEVEVEQDNNIDIDVLVKKVREKIKPLIQERCNTMRVLEMTQPIGLNDIYTSVNILEKITGRQRFTIDELLQEFTNEDFERFGLSRITEKRVPGLDAVKKYPKLIILGKPGAGKTTFLKYLAIQCIGAEFNSHLVPIFITLKDFAEAANKPGLLDYISKQFSGYSVETQNFTSLQDVIKNGRALVLLDGLDEIREEDTSRILKEIREFSDQFRDNLFVNFTAIEFIFGKQSSQEALQNLVTHITDQSWREVFLLAVGMSPSADCLLQLMKQQVDAIVVGDEKLQQFLKWVSKRSLSLLLECKPATVRAFYVEHDSNLNRSLILPQTLDFDVDHNLALTLACDVDDHLARTLALECDFNLALEHIIDLARALFGLPLNTEIKQALQKLKAQVPDIKDGIEIFKQWWEIKGQAWRKQLRTVMIKYRNIGHNWDFSNQQEELLMQYYDANKLLVDCLNSDCYVSREVRQKIEDELLLPIAEIKKRQQQIL